MTRDLSPFSKSPGAVTQPLLEVFESRRNDVMTQDSNLHVDLVLDVVTQLFKEDFRSRCHESTLKSSQ